MILTLVSSKKFNLNVLFCKYCCSKICVVFWIEDSFKNISDKTGCFYSSTGIFLYISIELAYGGIT